ncbi:hypothetical protein Fmac_018400 [Flemingia macrophylla]|uniref:Uncharacterized protein n=1 Tax=Flemingia macrophylla TaxID=520843 RepID=A0ABD1M4W0_9FABA
MTTTFSTTATASGPSPLPSPLPLTPTVVNCEFRDNRTRELDSWPALPDEVKECSKIVACFLACAGVRYHYDDFCRISYLYEQEVECEWRVFCLYLFSFDCLFKLYVSSFYNNSLILLGEKDGASFLGSNPDQMLGYYPFRNLRAAADLLFLHGGSDMVIAKQAIEACRLLPEITGPTSHPKIAEVLLERGSPDTTLMVLRWAGVMEKLGGPDAIIAMEF